MNIQRSVEELNAIIRKLNRELNSLRRYAQTLEAEILRYIPNYNTKFLNNSVIITLSLSRSKFFPIDVSWKKFCKKVDS